MVLNETSYFGAGAISVLPHEITRRGFRKALVVTDKVLLKIKVADKVLKLLDDNRLPYEIFSDVKENPTIANVHAGLDAYKASGADYLIAIGGGSSIDTAKAIGIIINNPEHRDVKSLAGAFDTKKRSVPLIAISTTAGTAAEVTKNYVITDEERKVKFPCVDPNDIPILAIVDADMMSSMPPPLTANTGMDALTHAIEGYIAKDVWEMTDLLNLKAIELIAKHLRKAVHENDVTAREGMALGQYLTGMGFSNGGLGIVHSMAHQLGGFYDTPHGIANAVLLPFVMVYNAPYTGEKYRDIAKAMGVAGVDGMSQQQYRDAAVVAVLQLSKDVGIPQSLREINVREEDIPALAASAMEDGCTPGNPRPPSADDIIKIFHSAM